MGSSGYLRLQQAVLYIYEMKSWILEQFHIRQDFLWFRDRNHYKNLKIPSVKKNTYFQPVPLQFESKPEISLNISEKDFKYYDDYISYKNGPDKNYKDEDIIYAGYGIEDSKYNDYKDLNVKDKIVIVIGGEPKDHNEEFFINGKQKSKWSNIRQEINLKSEIAKTKGALALIIVGLIQKFLSLLPPTKNSNP